MSTACPSCWAQGDGTFEPAQDFAVGLTPVSVAVGDFNGDSRQDLGTANVNGDSASILLRNGDGTFEPAQDFAVGSIPISITVGDFNGDGQQDLATANNSGGTVSILINQPAVEIITVTIDIKPADAKNRINPKGNANIRVAILTRSDFDATEVDPTTVRFGRSGTEAPPVHFALKDVDRDGSTDVVLQVKIRRTGIACGNTSASISGRTFGAQMIRGSDFIRTVGCKKG